MKQSQKPSPLHRVCNLEIAAHSARTSMWAQLLFKHLVKLLPPSSKDNTLDYPTNLRRHYSGRAAQRSIRSSVRQGSQASVITRI